MNPFGFCIKIIKDCQSSHLYKFFLYLQNIFLRNCETTGFLTQAKLYDNILVKKKYKKAFYYKAAGKEQKNWRIISYVKI